MKFLLILIIVIMGWIWLAEQIEHPSAYLAEMDAHCEIYYSDDVHFCQHKVRDYHHVTTTQEAKAQLHFSDQFMAGEAGRLITWEDK